MVNLKTFSMMALDFDDVTEQPHFHKISFRVRKKIFATLDTDNNKAVLKLSEHEQSIFIGLSKGAIYPVKGAWAQKGGQKSN